MSGKPVLTILKDGQTLRSLAVEDEVMLGRAKDCAVFLNDQSISRKHALFKRMGDKLQVEKKSEFGLILVNGAEISSSILNSGDIVSIGTYLIQISSEGTETKTEDRVTGPSSSDFAAPQGVEIESSMSSGRDSQASTEDASEKELEFEQGSEPSGGNEFSLDLENTGDTAETGAKVEVESSSDEAEESESLSQASSNDLGHDLGDDPNQNHEDGRTQITPLEKITVKLVLKPGAANFEEYPLTKNEVIIGRGKDCDIILNDKKSSRKNAIIRRVGNRFIIKDLNSVNGSFVNGSKITEQELSSDDLIRIGGVEIHFKAQSSDYAKQEKDFLSMPETSELPDLPDLENPLQDQDPMGADLGSAHTDPLTGTQDSPDSPNLFDPLQSGISLENQTGAADSLGQLNHAAGLGGIPGMGPASTGTQAKRTLLERFRALPKRTQIIGVVAALLLISWLMEEDEQPAKQKAPQNAARKTVEGTPSSGPTPGATALPGAGTGGLSNFDNLTAEQKAFIENEHTLAFDFYRNKDYDKALFEIGKILALVPDYKDTRELEKYAKEGKRKLEAIEEEKKKKENELALKEKIAQLVEQIRGLMDRKEYDKARPLFTDVLALDPDNTVVADWRREIQAEEERIKIEEQKNEAQLGLNRQGWEIYKQAMVLRKQRKYLSAMSELKKISEINVTDSKLQKLAESMILRSKANLRAAVQPVLEKAKELEDSGDLAGAFNWFKKVTKINPGEAAAYAGMSRVRGVLHDRAKILYTEAVLAESYSDFENAEKLYREIIKVAPADDIYHERAQRKLSHYLQRNEAPQP